MCWRGRHGWERCRFVKGTTGKLIPNKLLQLGYVVGICWEGQLVRSCGGDRSEGFC